MIDIRRPSAERRHDISVAHDSIEIATPQILIHEALIRRFRAAYFILDIYRHFHIYYQG